MDALMLDGNAIAGLLHELFRVEMTTAKGTCGQCGTTEQIGAAHVFRGAGIILRCPHCGNLLAAVVEGRRHYCVAFTGVQALEINKR